MQQPDIVTMDSEQDFDSVLEQLGKEVLFDVDVVDPYTAQHGGQSSSQEGEKKNPTTVTSTNSSTKTTSCGSSSSSSSSSSNNNNNTQPLKGDCVDVCGSKGAADSVVQLDVEVKLNAKNSFVVTKGGNVIEFVIYPTDVNTPKGIKETRIQYNADFWLKLAEKKAEVLQHLDNKEEGNYLIHQSKYIEVIEKWDIFFANIVVYSRKGTAKRDISVPLREAEFRQLMSYEPHITKLMRPISFSSEASKKRGQEQQGKGPAKSRKVMGEHEGNFFVWQCGQTVSTDIFFHEDHARANALMDPEVEENKENLCITSLKMPVPSPCKFVKYAYLYLWRRVAEEQRWGKNDNGQPFQKCSLEQALESAEVPPEWMLTFFKQYFITVGAPPPAAGHLPILNSLLSFVDKETLKKEAIDMHEDNTSYNLLCRYLLPSVLKRKVKKPPQKGQ